MALGVGLGLARQVPVWPRQVAHLLSYLGDLIIHRLLMGGHSVELNVELIDRLTKNFIGLSLCHNEMLHDAL